MGVPEYQMTSALWVRGLLDEEFGVPPGALRWFRGGLHEPGRVERFPLDWPSEIRIESIGADATLNDLLCEGEIDALMSACTPHAFLDGDRRVVRLFPDHRKAEKTYFAKTRMLPIMHVLAIRRELVDAHPQLANAVYDAFCRAKDLAVEAFSDVSALRVTLPWFAAEMDNTRARKALSRLLDYAHWHGTANRPLRLDEVFAPSTLVEHKL